MHQKNPSSISRTNACCRLASCDATWGHASFWCRTQSLLAASCLFHDLSPRCICMSVCICHHDLLDNIMITNVFIGFSKIIPRQGTESQRKILHRIRWRIIRPATGSDILTLRNMNDQRGWSEHWLQFRACFSWSVNAGLQGCWWTWSASPLLKHKRFNPLRSCQLMGYRTPTKSVHWQVKCPLMAKSPESSLFPIVFRRLPRLEQSPWLLDLQANFALDFGDQSNRSYSWCQRYFTIFHDWKAFVNLCPEKCGLCPGEGTLQFPFVYTFSFEDSSAAQVGISSHCLVVSSTKTAGNSAKRRDAN